MTTLTVSITCDEPDKDRLIQILYSMSDIIDCEYGIDCTINEVEQND